MKQQLKRPLQTTLAPRNNIAGNALIFALLIVAVTSIIAYALIDASTFAVRRTHQLNNSDACAQAVHAAEIHAMHLLVPEQVAVANNNATKIGTTTDLSQPWATPFTLNLSKDLNLTAQIHDLQGRFNLNTLAQNTGVAIYSSALIFTRLLGSLQIGNTQILQEAVSHWVEAESTASDQFYAEQMPAYRAAHMPLTSISELKLIQGFSVPIYTQLQPYVSALREDSKINVNTASSRVLAAVLDVEEDAVRTLVDERLTYAFTDTQSFVDRAKARGVPINPDADVTAVLDVNSEYFLLETKATCQKTELISYSFIRRPPKDLMWVYQRTTQL